MSTTTAENGKTFFDTVLDAQKQVYDNMKNSSEQFTKQFSKTNPLETNAEFFQKWYDEQMGFFNQAGKTGFNGSPNQYQELFNNWMTTQMNMFKSFVENTQKAAQEGTNPFNSFNSFGNFTNNGTQWTTLWNQWMSGVTENMNNLSKVFANGDAKQAFQGMMDNTNNFMKFSEMWAPIMKAINGKTFGTEMFTKMFDMNQYKTMMDQMFHMAPESVQNMVNEGQKLMNQWMTQGMDMTKGNWGQMNNQFAQMFPGMGNGMFQNMLDQYNTWSNALNQATSPLMKIMTPGSNRDQLESMNRISNLMVTFNLKNAQMSHLVYNKGLGVFEKLAELYTAKVQNGEQVTDMMAAYQEWLGLNDSVFTSLFETEEYSKLQAELASTGMKLKKELDLQVEKVLANVPVITRTEMDELYQTVYELKKRVRTLEKEQEEVKVEDETSENEVKAAIKSTKKTSK